MQNQPDLKTFQGPSMAEALDKVKRSLGRSAVILHTRTVRRGGLLGLGVKTWVEITASTDARVPEARSRSAVTAPPPRPATLPATLRGLPTQNSSSANSVVESPPLSADPGMAQEIREIRDLVRGLAAARPKARLKAPAEVLEYYNRLIQQRVADDLVRQIVQNVAHQISEMRNQNGAPLDDASVRAVVVRSLQDWIEKTTPAASASPPCTDGRPAVVALIGPTGVGKTTTLAKLAANAKLREGKSVGLITLDTYRIAAVEQLKTYAEILQIELKAVASPEEIPAALQALAGCELILIDTAGRSQRDEPKIAELAAFLQAAKPDRIHLVLSGTSAVETNRQAIERFAALGATEVIFTKLDEAVGLGAILSALQGANLRLSYITRGQNVPDDIEPGDPARLAGLLLGDPLTEALA